MLDVAIVGGGPAGLSAALVLARARRHIVLCDEGKPRNHRSSGVNGFLSRDGVDPAELRAIGKQQLLQYPNVVFENERVVDATPRNEGFELILAGGSRIECRKLLLATGLQVDLPKIDGLEALYGKGAYDCPYCDGWEVADSEIAIYGKGTSGKNLALELLGWSNKLILFTNGESELSKCDRKELDKYNITVCEKRLAAVMPAENRGISIHMQDGEVYSRRALFFISEECRASHLISKLGCTLTEKGKVQTKVNECTDVPGLYVAGDASMRVSFAIVAAAEGALAAFAINQEILREARDHQGACARSL
jgi:thioredoxin reductase